MRRFDLGAATDFGTELIGWGVLYEDGTVSLYFGKSVNGEILASWLPEWAALVTKYPGPVYFIHWIDKDK